MVGIRRRARKLKRRRAPIVKKARKQVKGAADVLK